MIHHKFLSTLSLRRATGYTINFHTKPGISIHALLAESDQAKTFKISTLRNFYPRSPCGERRSSIEEVSKYVVISIHALLAESDSTPNSGRTRNTVFLSTLSLRRATSQGNQSGHWERLFLSTLSLRRATVHYDNYNLHCVISIHALLAESDAIYPSSTPPKEYFYPRSPCGERPIAGRITSNGTKISIHALLAESDHRTVNIQRPATEFLSTLSLRRATHLLII